MKYRFTFNDGHTEDSEASSVSVAFRKLGYGFDDILHKLRSYKEFDSMSQCDNCNERSDDLTAGLCEDCYEADAAGEF